MTNVEFITNYANILMQTIILSGKTSYTYTSDAMLPI